MDQLNIYINKIGNPLTRKSKNQYTLHKEKKADVVAWLYSNSTLIQKSVGKTIIRCVKPNADAKGIHKNENKKEQDIIRYGKWRARISYNDGSGGNKRLKVGALDIVMDVFHPNWKLLKPSHYEKSHLCHNGWCINPKHVTLESHSDNMSRIGCKGLFFHKGQLYSMCKHTPKCLVISDPPQLESNSPRII